jgi:hypothetical protein
MESFGAKKLETPLGTGKTFWVLKVECHGWPELS